MGRRAFCVCLQCGSCQACLTLENAVINAQTHHHYCDPSGVENMTNIGDDVFVFIEATNEQCSALGKGIYLGMQRVPKGLSNALNILHDVGVETPTIKLCTDELVYGVEVWYGAFEKTLARLKGHHITYTTVKEASLRDVDRAFDIPRPGLKSTG